MRSIFILTLSFITCAAAIAQVPVMNPVAGPGAVCSEPSQATTFSASATNSPTQFYWSVLPVSGATLSSITGQTVSVTFQKGAGSYTIYCYATNASGASVPMPKYVVVYETPSVTFSGATHFCQGSSTFLMGSATMYSGSSTLSYLWSPGTGLSNQASRTTQASPTTSTNYTLFVNTQHCQGSLVVPVTVDVCLGVEEHRLSEQGLLAYPNPSDGTVHLRSKVSTDAVIINQLGGVVEKIHLPAGEERSLDHLHNGIYFIRTPNVTLRVIVAR